MLSHDETIGLQTDGSRLNDLIGHSILQDTILMNASLMGKSVCSDNGLIGLDRDTCDHGKQVTGGVYFLCVDGSEIGNIIAPRREGHDYLLERCVACPFPNTIYGNLDLPCPCLDPSQGIGRGIARSFAKEGSAVVINSRSLDRAKVAAQEIAQEGGEVFPVAADVTDRKAVESMVEEVIERFSKIDILVNNAGITFIRPAEDLSEEEWDRAVATDLKAYFLCSQAVGKTMIRKGGGRIINITSILAERALPQRLAYCTSKAGANMMTMVLALEWAKYNIRVNAIMPGFVATGLVPEKIDKKTFDREAIIQKTPLQRLAKVEDVGDAAVFLASEEADFITGTCLRVDGGWLAYGGW